MIDYFDKSDTKEGLSPLEESRNTRQTKSDTSIRINPYGGNSLDVPLKITVEWKWKYQYAFWKDLLIKITLQQKYQPHVRIHKQTNN